MPQWEFLDFLRDEARALPGFRLRMESEAVGFIEADGRVYGERGRTAVARVTGGYRRRVDEDDLVAGYGDGHRSAYCLLAA